MPFLGQGLAKDVVEDVGFFDSGQTLIEPEKREGQPLMIDSQLVEDGGIEIPYVDGV